MKLTYPRIRIYSGLIIILFLSCCIPKERPKSADCVDLEINDKRGYWEYTGPSHGGRTTALAFDIRVPGSKAVFAGSSGGGVWYNSDVTDDNIAWKELTGDQEPSLLISAIEVNRWHADEIFVGTGLYYMKDFDQVTPLEGNGMFRLIREENGQFHTELMPATQDSPDFRFVNAIKLHPRTMHLYVATLTGIHRSKDAGKNFEKVFDKPCTDMEILDNGDIIVAYGHPTIITTPFHLYRSSSGDLNTWEGLYTPPCGRVGLGNEYTTNCRYAFRGLLDLSNGVLTYIYTGNNYIYYDVSRDNGQTWTDPSILTGAGTQVPTGMFSLATLYGPDKNNIWFGATAFMQFVRGGNQGVKDGWRNSRNPDLPSGHEGVADIHSLIAGHTESGGSRVIVGSDFGVWELHIEGAERTQRQVNKGYHTALVRDVSPSTIEKRFITSTWDYRGYDHGYQRPEVAFGNYESKRCYFDTDDNVMMLDDGIRNHFDVFADGVMIREDIGLSQKGAYSESINTLYSPGGSNLNILTFSDNFLTETRELLELAEIDSIITYIELSPLSNTTVFAGTILGKVYKIANLDTDAPVVTALDQGVLPQQAIHEIDVFEDESHIAVLMKTQDGSYQIWKMDDSGWAQVTGNIPSVPLTHLVFQPNNPNYLYVGSYRGLFRSSPLAGSTVQWSRVEQGLPRSPVFALTKQKCSNMIVAGLFGRGVYYFRFE